MHKFIKQNPLYQKNSLTGTSGNRLLFALVIIRVKERMNKIPDEDMDSWDDYDVPKSQEDSEQEFSLEHKAKCRFCVTPISDRYNACTIWENCPHFPSDEWC